MALTDPHLERLHAALKSEETFARAAHARMAALPLADRVALGIAWSPVRFESEPGFGRDALRVLARGELHDGIGPGDRVSIGDVVGRCVGRDLGVAEIRLRADSEAWDRASASATVQLEFDAGSLVRYRQVLEAADALDSPLRTALLEADLTSEPVELDLGDARLNDAQRRAVSIALGSEALAVIHGPPGTGKTATLVVLLQHLPRPTWALAESNAATDHLALSAAAAGHRVVRVGPTFRMSGPAATLSIDARIAAGPFAEALRKLDTEIKRARREGGPALWKRLDARRDLRQQARQHELDAADVIASTLGTLVRVADDLPPAHTAVMDEVTQALEPAVWAAVPYVKRLILAGDPHQLGPVVTEPGNPLERGLLARLLEAGADLPMLDIQHRMHADIQALVEPVYGPAYRPHPAVETHTLADLADVESGLLTTTPALFIDTAGAGAEERDPRTQSVFEPLEVALVGRALALLREHGVRPDQIGVIAPYSAQVARLSALPEARDVEVATVNAFQGREAEVIVVSFTRSNPDGELGFVADRRRLTVAVTRARRALLMFGDSTTLGSHPAFRDLMDGVLSQSVWEDPWLSVMD